MAVKFDLYPGGKKRALTFSYDDGLIHDRRLVEIFNKYGMKGTFHLNSYNVENGRNHVNPDEIKTLYAGHEVACHMYTHPHVAKIPLSMVAPEVLRDRRKLERMAGTVVRGMSYPYGQCTDDIVNISRSCGIVYSRAVKSTEWFSLPDDFMRWEPTCHHTSPRLHELFDKLVDKDSMYNPLYLMYVWGHSFEFDRNNNWEVIENFCEYASGHDEVWYATNIEIYDYVTALRSICMSVDGDIAYNPSATDVWVSVDSQPTVIPAGKTVMLRKDK